MGLVDGEQAERQLRQPIHELMLQQALGGNIEQLYLAAAHGGKVLDHLLPAQGRVDVDGRHTVGAQAVDLILHQRDKRGDHHAQPRAQQRRYLEAE